MTGESNYPNLGSTRWIVEIEFDDRRVVLDDGSQWRVDSYDVARGWSKTTMVTVELADGEEHCVLNAGQGGKAPAVLLGFGPLGSV